VDGGVAVVTGPSKGVGFGVTGRFVQEGVRLIAEVTIDGGMVSAL
jgi:NAD(P)-dependent dehydrogenase (short-subunit alcohol dehydrogenase family)